MARIRSGLLVSWRQLRTTSRSGRFTRVVRSRCGLPRRASGRPEYNVASSVCGCIGWIKPTHSCHFTGQPGVPDVCDSSRSSSAARLRAVRTPGHCDRTPRRSTRRNQFTTALTPPHTFTTPLQLRTSPRRYPSRLNLASFHHSHVSPRVYFILGPVLASTESLYYPPPSSARIARRRLSATAAAGATTWGPSRREHLFRSAGRGRETDIPLGSGVTAREPSV